MAKLNAKKQNALPDSSFAFPSDRSYPINDEAHATQALRMKGHLSPADQKTLVRKVCARYPDLHTCQRMDRERK